MTKFFEERFEHEKNLNKPTYKIRSHQVPRHFIKISQYQKKIPFCNDLISHRWSSNILGIIKMINRRCFITGIKGTKLSQKEVVFLKKYKPWGVILFSRNIASIPQTQKLTSHIKKLFNDKICKSIIIFDQDCSLNKPIAIITMTLAPIRANIVVNS